MTVTLILLEAALLASALSLDAFVASFAYGSNQIKIPPASVLVIDLVCSATVGISLLGGSFLRDLIPPQVTAVLCFGLLFLLGLFKLLDSLTKSLIRKYSSLQKELRFRFFNFRFVLSLYADPEMADQDCSKTISPGEAASLAVALSLDGMAAGFGAALGNVNIWAVLLCSFATNALAVLLGCRLGNRLAQKLRFNLSWISGAILLLLAFGKLC